MPTVAVSHAALAKEDAFAALSRCASVQTWLGTTAKTASENEADALALIFLQDAGEVLPDKYLLVTCTPRPPIKQAGDLIQRIFEFEVEACTTDPGGDTSQDDFVFGLNLDEVSVELEAQHNAGVLDFEMSELAVTDVPLRDDENSDDANDILNVIRFSLESWGE